MIKLTTTITQSDGGGVEFHTETLGTCTVREASAANWLLGQLNKVMAIRGAELKQSVDVIKLLPERWIELIRHLAVGGHGYTPVSCKLCRAAQEVIEGAVSAATEGKREP